MALFSAYEDFMKRTLGALDGTWAKLVFVTSLRGEKDHYEHWGLEYTHGPKAARAAVVKAHSEIFQQVLESPIPELQHEVSEELTNAEQMIPTQRNGCSPEHFRYLVKALSFLKSRSNRQVA
jgi:hypothetical protein